MRSLNLLIVFLHLFGIALQSKAQPVSKESYNRAVDYVACKCTELSNKHPIADTIPPKADSTKEKPKISKPKPCSWGVSSKGVQEALQATGSPAKTVNLVADLNKEKNHYRPNWAAKDVVQYLTVDVFSNQTRSAPLYQFRERRKEDFMPFQAELQRTLTGELEREAMEGAGNTTSRDQQAEKREKVEDKSKDQDVATANPSENQTKLCAQQDSLLEANKVKIKKMEKEQNYVWIGIFILTAGIIYCYWLCKRQNEKISDLNNACATNEAVKKKEDNLIGRIEELEKDIKLLKESVKPNYNPTTSVPLPNEYESRPPDSPVENKPWLPEAHTTHMEPKTEFFYIVNPNTDGSFNAASATPEFKTGSSIYLFRKLRETQAEFEIDMREEALQRALKYPKINIDPACDIVSSYNPEAKRISIAQKGMAELRGDKWVVTRKAQIRYEI